MKEVLLYVWQLPQHLLALLVWGALRAAGKTANVSISRGRADITTDTPGWGISLGRYVFMDKRYGPEDWKHEFGHCAQSERLGPLYLPVVGLPSALANNLWDRLFHKSWPAEKRLRWYYSRYPEKQADKLGGVQREYQSREAVITF